MLLQNHPRKNEPRIFGTTNFQNIELSPRQKHKIEAEVIDWIRSHDPRSKEVQFWLSLERVGKRRSVNCHLEIVDDKVMWESFDFSKKPFRAFRRCLAGLDPGPQFAWE